MVYRAPDTQTFLVGRSWRSYLDTGVALSGVVTGVLATQLPKLFIPITLVTTGYGLARLYSGVPRSLTIDGSVMRLRFWARRRVVLTLGATQVPDEIVLVSPDATYAIQRSDFASDDFDACAALLKARCPHCIEKPILRPPRG